jgi:hypothetical protein
MSSIMLLYRMCRNLDVSQTLSASAAYYRDSFIATGQLRDCRDFLFSTPSGPSLGPTQPPKQLVPGALYPGIKRPFRKTDHSLPTSAKVKKAWIYTSTLHISEKLSA